jgi:hypothetical protein
MNPILALWTTGTLVVAVVCVVSTFFIRSIVETAFPSLQAVYHKAGTSYLSGWARWWNQVVLYSLPVLTGGLLGLMKSTWLWPAGVTTGVRILLGIVVGWFSTLIYKVVRRAIKERLKMDLPDVPAPVTTEAVEDQSPTDPGAPLAEDPVPPTERSGTNFEAPTP